MNHDPLTVKIADTLLLHQHQQGMVVASGHTCACGYWTGNESPGKTRPAGYQGLLWHQAEVVAAVVNAHVSAVPDETYMDRGFGNCPHCRSPLVTRCHECLNEIFRDEAHAAGWRMDHLGGFGCIALCPDHK